MKKSFDTLWEEIHAQREWGKYPSEPVIRFVARQYYSFERNRIRILDFGCGAGSNTWYLAREGFDTYAFDGSQSAISRVKERLFEEGLEADLRVRDALDLDYEEDSFDCVIDNVTIYANYLENIKEMYKIVHGLLKCRGKLFSVCFTPRTTGYGTGKKLEENTFCDIEYGSLAGRGTSHFFEKKELKELLECIGFQNIVIDVLSYTDGGNVVEQLLVQAEKGRV